MNYEKLYKDALERMKSWAKGEHPECFSEAQKAAEFIFPELKEEEGEDEKIRKTIIRIFKGEIGYTSKEDANKYVIWLEKQGEQKSTLPKVWKYKKDHTPLLKDSFILNKYGCVLKSPSGAIVSDVWVLDYDELTKLPKEELEKQGENKPTENYKPKFHEGEWITNGNDTWKVVEVKTLDYILQSQDGNIVDDTISYVDEYFHLWTIADAKDGDVLYAKGSYFKEYIFKFSSFTEDNVISTHFGYDVFHETFDTKLSRFGREEDFVLVNPATKEQRDLLFHKMKEAGYEWDSEKIELKKIEPKILDAEDVLPYLGNNQVQDILEDMGMLDDNGRCPHTAEEIFKAGMEHAFNLNREAASKCKN